MTTKRTVEPPVVEEGGSQGTIRLVIAEDHSVVAEGIATMLSFEKDMEILGLVDSGEALVEAVETLKPDVALVDVQLSGMDGLVAVRELQIRQLPTRAMALTMYTDEATVARSVSAGVAGYLPKNIGREELVGAVRAVAAGKGFLHPEVTRPFLQRVGAAGPESRASELSAREQQVLEALADGMSTKRIAETLELGEETVKSHLSRLYTKLDVSDRVQAVVTAMRTGLVR